MIRINELRSDKELDISKLKVKAAKLLRIKSGLIDDIRILKKSLDARHKGEILHIYSVALSLKDEEQILKRVKDRRVSRYQESSYELPVSAKCSPDEKRPVVAGFGPAGMFAALYLSYAGKKPIVLERGLDVDSRHEKVHSFWKEGRLDTECNVQFGEGGAGTFSDGKLQTGVKDKKRRDRFILEAFVRYGAPENILTDSKPHIGSDILRDVVKNLRQDIIAHGGSVHFGKRFTGYETDNDGVLRAIRINDDGYLECDSLILAAGHSARDTFKYLYSSGMKIEKKGFAVGLRVQHLQQEINNAMYGSACPVHEPASYKLTYHASSGRGVYSFCMCPGGFVINSSSEKDMLCVNGMSYSGRDGKNANSAIVVTVTPEDFDASGYGRYGVLAGMEFQRELERRAFSEGRGLIPCQTFSDFKENRCSSGFGSVSPECRGDFTPANLRNILPENLSKDMIEAFSSFGERVQGFDSCDAVLSGVESRTSSPVRILRNECFLSSVPGIYPAGEGAGYAGGIMSAAIDGLKCAEALIANQTIWPSK